MKGMSRERFNFLMSDITALLNPAEIAEGWHFCQEYDGLLMHLGTMGCICDFSVCDDGGNA